MAAAGPFGLGPLELVIILLVLVMIFGASRLADLGGSLGKGIKEFKKNVQDDDDDEAPVARSTMEPAADTGATGTVNAVRCPSCGTLNVAGSKHCSNCGASIAATVS